MPKATTSIDRNGKSNVTAKIRQLTKELAAAKKELQVERRWRKKLQRAVLPLCPKEWEDQIPDAEEVKRMAASQPPLREFLASLWK
jgi:hypothetical protein